MQKELRFGVLIKGIDTVCYSLLENIEKIDETGYSEWSPDDAFNLSDVVELADKMGFKNLSKFFKCIEDNKILLKTEKI